MRENGKFICEKCGSTNIHIWHYKKENDAEHTYECTCLGCGERFVEKSKEMLF